MKLFLSLIPSSLKVKEYYINTTVDPPTLGNINLYVINIKKSKYRFSTKNITQLLRILLYSGYFCTDYQSDEDIVGYSSGITITLESFSSSMNAIRSVISSTISELIDQGLKYEVTQSKQDIYYIKVNTNALAYETVYYELLDIHITFGSYGIVNMGDKSTYLVGGCFNNSNITHAVAGTAMLSEIINNNSIVLPPRTISMFSLPDDVTIKYKNKIDNAIVLNDDSVISLEEVQWMNTMLPDSGQFKKQNVIANDKPTIVLVNTSWKLSPSQIRYVSKHKRV